MNESITLSVAECKAIRALSEDMKIAVWSPRPLVEHADGVYDLMGVRYEFHGEFTGSYYMRNVELNDYLDLDITERRCMARTVIAFVDDHPECWVLAASQRGFDKFLAFAAADDEDVELDMDVAPPFELAFRPR